MRQRSDPIAHSGGQGSSAAARVVKSQLVALVANSGGHDSTMTDWPSETELLRDRTFGSNLQNFSFAVKNISVQNKLFPPKLNFDVLIEL